MPLMGRKSDEISLLDTPQERNRKIKIMQENQAQDMESVRVVNPLDYPEVFTGGEPNSAEPVLTEWDAYRTEGITTMKEALVIGRDAFERAEAWAKQISVVPGDARPLIRELAHKSKLIVDELKDLR